MSVPARAARPHDPAGSGYEELFDVIGMEPSRRADGWTAERQRLFLVTLAEGTTVEAAAARVGLSPQSAYAFRQRAAGAAFALGWHAALLLQRQKLADLLTSRAFDGQVDTLTRADGSTVQRHRHDNRLGLALLTRLDRLAAADERADRHGEAEAARLVAGEWQCYLDLVAAEASPAQAGLFLAARARTNAPAAAPAAANDTDPLEALAPVLALARADLYCRARVGTAGEVDTTDLDPAHRAGWTAEQWTRAEAAGLIALAPDPQLPQHSHDPDGEEDEEEEQEDDHVWFDPDMEEWRTAFPPPPATFLPEYGCYGDHGYSRTLSVEEEAIVAPAHARAEARRRAAAERERAAWFAARAAAAAAVAPAAADDDWEPPLGASPAGAQR